MQMSFRVGSLIADFVITFTNAINESLAVLEQEYLQALNGSIIGNAAILRLTGKYISLLLSS